ncbi:MAG: VCBS repeat-containing protein, partial [Aureliella sp.]
MLHLLIAVLCLVQPIAVAYAQLNFVDVSAQSGIDFTHVVGDSGAGYLPSLMASGLALLDYDNDGLCDAYFLNGHHLPQPQPSELATNQLFRNVGQNKFENVSTPSGSADTAFALGVAVADIDNDGFQDMAVSNLGGVTLLRNNGDGTFRDATQAAGLSPSAIAFGAGVAFLDAENDGDLDLYVADYVDFQFDGFTTLAKSTYPYPPGPDHFPARSDHLYLNAGDGTFADISRESGIAAVGSPSMGVVCGDFDGDHDSDIFVCSDAKPNLLWINDGQGVFQESAELYGVAYNSQGRAVGSMGVEPADIDNDGVEDLFITDYSA